MKPFSEACEQNKDPILKVLLVEFSGCRKILEVGSGTGQHAAYFSRLLPDTTWQTSDLADSHDGIQAWLNETGGENLLAPITLDVSRGPWPTETYDGVFSANTAHIMSWVQVQDMFRGISKILTSNGVFCLYGPFNYGGLHTSESNARFDKFLRDRDPDSGIRDFEALNRLAAELGWAIKEDHAMPVNNRTLVWRKG